MDRLTHLVPILWDATDVYRSFYDTDVTNRYRVWAEHAVIVKAAAAHDLGAVIALLDDHREHAIDQVADAMSREDGPATCRRADTA